MRWILAAVMVAVLGAAGAVEAAAQPIPPDRYDWQVVSAKKVARHVEKILMVDPDLCLAYFGEKPRKRFVRKTAKVLAAQNEWFPRINVSKGVRQGFRKGCR